MLKKRVAINEKDTIIKQLKHLSLVKRLQNVITICNHLYLDGEDVVTAQKFLRGFMEDEDVSKAMDHIGKNRDPFFLSTPITELTFQVTSDILERLDSERWQFHKTNPTEQSETHIVVKISPTESRIPNKRVNAEYVT